MTAPPKTLARQSGDFSVRRIGGDISSGMPDLLQLVIRPTLSTDPWRMPGRGLYLASSSAGLSGDFATTGGPPSSACGVTVACRGWRDRPRS